MSWYDREVERIEKDYDEGVLTNEEYDAEMRDLNESLRAEAEERAEAAYNDTMGYY